MPRILISTAEPSAELHASRLARALLKELPGLEIDAAGSGAGALASAGANIVCDMSGRAVMGFWEVLGHLNFYRRAHNALIACLKERRHDALIVVDAPSFNLRLAKAARKLRPDLPIIYYIAPKLWAWKEWRIKNLRRDITRTLCIFPFEVDFFSSRGVDARYVGNPTLDQIRDLDGSAMSVRLGVDSRRARENPAEGILAVFPGSRGSELKRLWPIAAAAVSLLKKNFPRLKPAVALAPGVDAKRLAGIAPLPDGADFVDGASQELLAASSIVLAKSGTTTLEAALLGVPMAVFYATNPATYHIAKALVKIKRVALPNIIARADIVSEFLQGRATPENLAAELSSILSEPGRYGRMRADLLALRQSLGDVPSAVMAAREIAPLIGT